jgi:ribonuclease HI
VNGQANMLVFDLEIIREDNGRFLFRVSNASDEAFLWFRPGDKNLEIIPGNGISGILTLHISQIRRLLHNKRLSTFYSGFRIRFCIQALKDVPAFTDRKRIIALDRRGGNHFIYPQEESPPVLRRYSVMEVLFRKREPQPSPSLLNLLLGNTVSKPLK